MLTCSTHDELPESISASKSVSVAQAEFLRKCRESRSLETFACALGDVRQRVYALKTLPIGLLFVVFERLWATASTQGGISCSGVWPEGLTPPSPDHGASRASIFRHSEWMVFRGSVLLPSSRSSTDWLKSGADQGPVRGRDQVLPMAFSKGRVQLLWPTPLGPGGVSLYRVFISICLGGCTHVAMGRLNKLRLDT